MPHLVKEDHLIGFLTSLGFSAENLQELDHETLLGFTDAILDYEARCQRDPGTAGGYGHDGYVTAVHQLAKRDTSAPDQQIGYATLSVRLAEQHICHLLALVGQLQADSAETPPLVPAARSLTFAVGLLLNMTNSGLTDEQYKEGIRAAVERISEARQRVADTKKALRERGVKV